MGKKNKKLRKIMRSQILQEQKQQAASPQVQPVREVQPDSADRPIETLVKPEVAENIEVKREIRKILLTVLILICIIVGVYVVNLKSDIILKLGRWLTQTLNINV
jgi:uncharacterized membrane protein YcjF (UPF0283 family)